MSLMFLAILAELAEVSRVIYVSHPEQTYSSLDRKLIGVSGPIPAEDMSNLV